MQIIFIHGSGGCKESWQNQTQYFEGSEAVNLPGHPDGALCPSIKGYADWLKDVSLERGYEEIVVVGHSLGGGIALQFALDYPEMLAGVILIGSGARLKVHPSFLAFLQKAVEDQNMPEEFSTSPFEKIEPQLKEILQTRANENGPESFLNDMQACNNFDVMDRVPSIQLPLLAICGDEDVMTPPKYSKYLVEQLPNAKSVIIPGGTHMVYAEKPEEVNKEIEAFLLEIAK